MQLSYSLSVLAKIKNTKGNNLYDQANLNMLDVLPRYAFVLIV